MNTALPTKAKAALSVGRRVDTDNGTIVFYPFTMRRLLLLYSIESPLVCDTPRLGNGIGWSTTAYVMAMEDIKAVEHDFVIGGIEAIVDAANTWAEDINIGIDTLLKLTNEIKAMFIELMSLDKQDKVQGEVVTEAGKSPQPETAS